MQDQRGNLEPRFCADRRHSGSQPSSDRDTETVEQQRVLIERILASSVFEKSARLRDFLQYICDRSLNGHPEEVHEQFIGHRVFDRPIDYNSNDDNIVRVSARHLRAKLHEYFETDGQKEPWLVEIPRGGYLPVFRKRWPQAPTISQAGPAVRTNPRPLLRKWGVVLIIIAAVMLLSIGVWGWKRAQGGVLRASQTPTASPIVDFFASSKGSVRVVLSDSALVLMQTLVGHPFSLAQYADHSYRDFPNKLAHQPGMESFWTLLSRREISNVGDEEAGSRFVVSMLAHGSNVAIRNARNMTVRDFMSGNFILLGTQYSDPWTRLFLKDLNFQFAGHVIRNLNPSKGEKREYPLKQRGQANSPSYAHVALVPNLTDTGRVLLVAGLDMQSTEAASDFLLDPASMQKFQQIIGTHNVGRLPNFELLLQTSTLAGAPKTARIVAFRVHRNLPSSKSR